MEIFKLVGSIMIDNTAANQSIAKTEKQAEGLGQTMAAGFKEVAAVGATVAGIATAIGTALYKLGNNAADYGDNVAKSALRMRVTTDEYQKLAFIAEHAGVSMSTLEQAAKQLEGTDLDVSTALENIMSVDDLTARREAAIQTFGDRVAYQLEPMLNMTYEEYTALQSRVEELGGIMDKDGIDASVAFKDAVTDLNTAWTGLKNNIGLSVLPTLTLFVNWISDTAIPAVREFIGLLNMHDEIQEAIAPGSTTYEPTGWWDRWENAIYGDISGSHAAGLPTVPYDNYRANLHRGETVLNANDTNKLQDLLNGATGDGSPVNITVQNILDGKVIGEFTYQYNRRKAQALGI